MTTFAARILAALARAKSPLSVAEICQRSGATMAAVKVNLHRLDKAGLLVKHPNKYEIRKGGAK